MIRAIYVDLATLSHWITEAAHVTEGRLAVGDTVRESHDGQVAIYCRLTAPRWRRLRAAYLPEAIAHLREALIEVHGAELLTRGEAA